MTYALEGFVWVMLKKGHRKKKEKEKGLQGNRKAIGIIQVKINGGLDEDDGAEIARDGKIPDVFYKYVHQIGFACERVTEFKDDFKSFELDNQMLELLFVKLEKTEKYQFGEGEMGELVADINLRNLLHIQEELLIEQLDMNLELWGMKQSENKNSSACKQYLKTYDWVKLYRGK